MDALEMMKYPTVTLTAEEVELIEKQIEGGALPPDYLEKCDEARETNVFGLGYKTDRRHNPIEQGIGSSGNQTRNSIEAYKKYGKHEPDFEENVKRMEKELAESNERRKAAAAARTAKKPVRRFA
jgi:hypothetical protein